MKFGDKVGHAYTSLYSEQGSGEPQEAISLSSVYYDVTHTAKISTCIILSSCNLCMLSGNRIFIHHFDEFILM